MSSGWQWNPNYFTFLFPFLATTWAVLLHHVFPLWRAATSFSSRGSYHRLNFCNCEPKYVFDRSVSSRMQCSDRTLPTMLVYKVVPAEKKPACFLLRGNLAAKFPELCEQLSPRILHPLVPLFRMILDPLGVPVFFTSIGLAFNPLIGNFCVPSG